jgi:hypothetical protein
MFSYVLVKRTVWPPHNSTHSESRQLHTLLLLLLSHCARSSLLGLMPAEDDFPFSVRLTADILSSSGSSSMAAVCAGSLALRAAGVPMQGMAAGISVGLVTAVPPQLQGPGVGRECASWQQQQQQQAGSEAGAADGSSHSDDMLGYSWHIAQGLGQRRGGQHRQPADRAAAAAAAVAADSAELQQDQQQQDEELAAAGSSSSDGSSSDSSSSSSSDDEQESCSSSSSSSTGLLRSSYGSALLLTDIQGIEDHHGDMDFKVNIFLAVTYSLHVV